MKKGKRVLTITIGIMCFILTYVMFMQFRTVEETNITEIETLTESELREKLASWRSRYEETNEKLTQTNATLAEYRQKRESNQEASELLEKELLQAKKIAGLTDVEGEGVIVTITDTNNDIEEINDETLTILLNELKLAGAEAISINDERIVNMSDIVKIEMSDGSTFILVNKKRVVSPYVVKAIGDKKYLESALTTKTVGFMDQFPKSATLETKNNIVINKYSSEIKIKYSSIKEEK